MITVRPANKTDAFAMTNLLNAIIDVGGTTAHQRHFDEARMMSHYLAPPSIIVCHVALEQNVLLGFQSLEWSNDTPSDPYARPSDWAYIASFVKDGHQGKGVGAQLFKATESRAKKAKVKAIDATIRADNAQGLSYYAKMGFRDDGLNPDVPLRDGTKVDRIKKALYL